MERGEGFGGVVFVAELDVDVANHVVGEVVADVEGFNVSEFGEFKEDVLVEVLEVLLDLGWVYGLALWVHSWGYHVWSLVHVGEEQRWGYAWPVVQTRAPVAVSARADLEVEWTVHPVLLRPEY